MVFTLAPMLSRIESRAIIMIIDFTTFRKKFMRLAADADFVPSLFSASMKNMSNTFNISQNADSQNATATALLNMVSDSRSLTTTTPAK